MAILCNEISYQNFGRCICLENGVIRLIATLDVGPRIIYFGSRGNGNILFEDVRRDFCELTKGYGTWYAYGGHRLWSAPEVMPETYYPDNSKVDWDFSGGVLTLTPKATPFGKQFILSVKMSEGNSVQIRNEIRNISEEPAVFAPWSVTGLAGGGTEFVPLSTEQTGFLPNRTVALWSYTDIKDSRFMMTDSYATLRHDTGAAKSFKVGFNVTEGYAVYCAGNQVFKLNFDGYDGSVQYPDFACNFETFTNKHFLECELLGALRAYQPGESAVIEETWEIRETDLTPEHVIASLSKGR